MSLPRTPENIAKAEALAEQKAKRLGIPYQRKHVAIEERRKALKAEAAEQRKRAQAGLAPQPAPAPAPADDGDE